MQRARALRYVGLRALTRLADALARYKQMLAEAKPDDADRTKTLTEIVKYYQSEYTHFESLTN